MKKLLFLLLLMACLYAKAQNIGINNPAPAASALLDLTSTNKGLLAPRMNSAQRLAIVTPATGLLVYDTSFNQFFYFDGTIWRAFASNNSAWNVTGNAGTVASTNFLGTTDNIALQLRTNNVPKLEISAAGFFRLGDAVLFPSPPVNGLAGTPLVDIATTTSNNNIIMRSAGSGTAATYLTLMQSEGTLAAPSLSLTGDVLGGFIFAGFTTGGFERSGGMEAIVDSTVTGNVPTSLNFRTSNATAVNAIRMKIDRNGNIGVGTVAPTTINSYTSLCINNTVNGGILDLMTNGVYKMRLVNTTSSATIETNTGIPLVISPQGVEAVRVTPTGSTGIGTPTPSAKLSVSKTGIDDILTLADANSSLVIGTDFDMPTFMRIRPTLGTGIAITNNGDNIGLFVTSNAATNVGIGTSNPLDKLHVLGNIRMVDGLQAAGKVMTSNANGTASWQTLPAAGPAWSLTGNAGTVAPQNFGPNFIGTTDLASLEFRVNNVRGAFIGANGLCTSSFFGQNAGLNSSGLSCNSFFGMQTGMGTASGDRNAFFGSFSGKFNISGNRNTFIGEDAGLVNVSGSDNIALGFQASFGFNNLNNAVAIGTRSRVDISNGMVLGSINGINGATANTNVGIGITDPKTALDIFGSVTLRTIAPITLTGATNNLNNTIVNGMSYFKTSSNDIPANRTLILADGIQAGQLFIIECTATGTSGIRVVDNAAVNNTNTGGNRDLLSGDIITLIWNGTDWMELSFANN